MIKEKINIYIPQDGMKILSILDSYGYEGFVVGGCVRDSIMGLSPKDWDMTTNSPPEVTLRIFEEKGYRVIETGLKHGTVTIMAGDEPYEVTTYRIEGEYIDNRAPSSVEFTSSLKEDLKRRDLTINAMAYNPQMGLKDFFNGVEDIQNGIIRCVGDAHERFNEDALRMLRAIRFSSRLGFGIEKETLQGIIENAHLITNISSERIREELNKIIMSDGPVKGLKLLKSTGIMEIIMPELMRCDNFDQMSRYHHLDVLNHIFEVVKNTPQDLETKLAALFHDIGKPLCFTKDEKGGHFYGHAEVSADIAESIMKRLKYDNKTIANVKSLVKEHMIQVVGIKKKTIRKVIGRIGDDNMFKLFSLMRGDRLSSHPEHSSCDDIQIMREKTIEIIEANEVLRVPDLKIGGGDLMKMGLKPGPNFGRILNELLEICLEDPSKNTKEELSEIVKNMMDEIE